MNFLDLFAGIGGFRMGMERAGHHCVGYVEIDKFARQSYEAIYDTTGEWTAHDITQAENKDWRQFKGRVDVICGGFPCQSFSIAGKRKGFADETRGTLFFEIARAAKEIKPSYLFLENVKGLLNHDKGRTFRTVIQTLDELGYDAEWQLCNSKNFGVPQNRERIIIIGHLRGASTREVFFDAGEDGQVTSSNEIKVVGNTSNTGYGSGDVLDSDGISTTLTATDYKHVKQIAVKQIGNISDSKSFGGNPQVGRVYDPEGLSPTLNTMTGGGREPKIIQRARGNNSGGFHDIAPTLTVNSYSENNLLDIGTYRIRKLTPRECWRLQGFPDWAFDKAKNAGISNSQLYKQAGNSVTVPLMEFIANRL